MKLAKRMFSMLLVVAMLIGMMPLMTFAASYVPVEVIASGYCGGEGDGTNLKWQVTELGTLYITGIGAMKDYDFGYDNPPWFDYYDMIDSVIIENGVTTICEYAFHEFAITSVTIPISITTIEDLAFSYCLDLENIYYKGSQAQWLDVSKGTNWDINAGYHTTNRTYIINYSNNIAQGTCGDNVTWTLDNEGTLTISGTGEINSESWYDYRSQIKNIIIKYGITKICAWAFDGCKNIESVTIPETVTNIGTGAFYNCGNLKSVNITNLSKWCEISFLSDVSNPLCYGADLILDGKKVTDLVIPESVTRLKEFAFKGCQSITSVAIHNKVTHIGGYVFAFCSNLENISYGGTQNEWNNVTKSTTWDQNVGENTINGTYTMHFSDALIYGTCGDNVTWTLDNEGTLTISGTGVMLDYTSSNNAPWYEYRTQIKNILIENGVTNIGNYAFYNCTNLTGITIPTSISSIDDYAFSNCTSLANIMIPNSVENIGYRAFYWCRSLESIEIPNSIKNISGYTFYYCTSLTSVSIPESVKSIGGSAFAVCSGLTSITIPSGVTSIGSYAFENCKSLKDIYYQGTSSEWENITKGTKWDSNVGGGEYSVNCTEVEEPAIPKPSFSIAATNVSMGNNLDIQFAIPKSAIADWTGHYAVISKEYADGRENSVDNVPFKNWTTNGNYYVVTATGIAAKEMSDEITVVICDANGNAVSYEFVQSMRNYAMTGVRKAGATALQKRLFVDMLKYGAAAQTNFGYGTNDLATALLTAEELAYGTNDTPTFEKKYTRGTYHGASNLKLESNILFQIALKNMTEGMYARIEYTGHTGTVYSKTYDASNLETMGNYKVANIDTMVIADARQPITIIVYNADGSIAGASNESIENYCAMGGATGLPISLISYADSAYAWLHK